MQNRRKNGSANLLARRKNSLKMGSTPLTGQRNLFIAHTSRSNQLLFKIAKEQSSNTNSDKIKFYTNRYLDSISGGQYSFLKSMQSNEAMRCKVKSIKHAANVKANHLFNTNDCFKQHRISFVKSSILTSSPLISFSSLQGQIQFRFVLPKHGFGTPNDIFKNGMPPKLFRTNRFHPVLTLLDDLEMPFAMDSIQFDNERAGWTFGGVPTSSNLLYSAEAHFISHIAQANGYIYAIAINETASLANCIHKGIISNSERAEEHMNTHLEPTQIMAARQITEKGELTEVIFNPAFKRDVNGDAKLIKFLEAGHINELKVAAFFRGYEHELPHLKQDAMKIFSDLQVSKIKRIQKIVAKEKNFSGLFHQRVAENKAELQERFDSKANNTPPSKTR